MEDIILITEENLRAFLKDLGKTEEEIEEAVEKAKKKAGIE